MSQQPAHLGIDAAALLQIRTHSGYWPDLTNLTDTEMNFFEPR